MASLIGVGAEQADHSVVHRQRNGAVGDEPVRSLGETRDLTGQQPEVFSAMSETLERWSTLRPKLTPKPVGELDLETRRQLEALGYIDGERGPKRQPGTAMTESS